MYQHTLALVTLALVLINGQTFVGPQYQSQTNTQKAQALMQAVTNDSTPGSFPSLGLIELFIENMDVSFDTIADDMPLQFAGLQRRPKLIHSVGVVAVGSWISGPGNQYSGVFKGCRNLLVRFSCPTAPTNSSGGYTPGISLKCLRSGVPSANMFAMYSLEGQDGWNFFKHDLTNHVPDLANSAPFLLQQVRATFAKASAWPVMLGVSDFASVDQDGNAANPVKFPFRLIFHPVTSVHNSYPDTPSDVPFEQILAKNIMPGPLYFIYAQDQPLDTPDKYILIGRIDLRTNAVTSKFGDKYMYFQHSRMEDDFKIHPEWVQPAQAIIKHQQETPHFKFPDLPFD